MRYEVLAFVVLYLVQFCTSAKILTVLHTPSYSHFVVGEVIAKELVAKGHEVTVISPFPQKAPIKNYKDVELKEMKEWFLERLSKMDLLVYENRSIFGKMAFLVEIAYEMTKLVYSNEDVKKLMNSGEQFDAIIIEQFFSEGLFGLCYLFKAPCIVFSAVGSSIWTNRLVGNIGLASYIPDINGCYSPKMTFSERMHNVVSEIFQEVVHHLISLPQLNELLHEYIPTAPHITKLASNVSLLLLNSHTALTGAVPLTPNMIEIGGIHLQTSRNVKLSEDVQQFLDEHDEGVVYFAFGSNFRSKDLPPEQLQAILTALKKYGKPVLWKFEEELPDDMNHVKIAKWFPQTAVLAHKNVKAFITHCGRLSSLESLYYGVPMIGISLFAEQAHNAAEMEYLGYALWIKLKTLTAENLYDALVEITTNSKYSNEAKLRSKAMRKENQIEKTIGWIEHVIEFKGATYLRNAGIDLPWYQFWMVDVMAFIVISTLTVNVIIAYVILNVCCKSKSKSFKDQSRKRGERKKIQ